VQLARADGRILRISREIEPVISREIRRIRPSARANRRRPSSSGAPSSTRRRTRASPVPDSMSST
jgi:hypothetical protein